MSIPNIRSYSEVQQSVEHLLIVQRSFAIARKERYNSPTLKSIQHKIATLLKEFSPPIYNSNLKRLADFVVTPDPHQWLTLNLRVQCAFSLWLNETALDLARNTKEARVLTEKEVDAGHLAIPNEYNQNFINIRTPLGSCTVLGKACFDGNLKRVRELCQRPDCDVNFFTTIHRGIIDIEFQMPALFLALMAPIEARQKKEIIQILLSANANILLQASGNDFFLNDVLTSTVMDTEVFRFLLESLNEEDFIEEERYHHLNDTFTTHSLLIDAILKYREFGKITQETIEGWAEDLSPKEFQEKVNFLSNNYTIKNKPFFLLRIHLLIYYGFKLPPNVGNLFSNEDKSFNEMIDKAFELRREIKKQHDDQVRASLTPYFLTPLVTLCIDYSNFRTIVAHASMARNPLFLPYLLELFAALQESQPNSQ